MFSVIVLSVVMLSVIYVECRIFYCSAMFHLQSVIMLIVIILSVVTPLVLLAQNFQMKTL